MKHPKHALTGHDISHCRKTDGKKYSEGVDSFKNAMFPYPTMVETPEEVIEDKAPQERSEASYVGQIADLQARLHRATSQLEQTNASCVLQAETINSLKLEIEDDKKVIKKIKQENSVLRRRVADLEPEGDIARTVRPGPALKPFEALTPRQQKVASDDIQSKILKTSKERNILPTKLSAFLTYR